MDSGLVGSTHLHSSHQQGHEPDRHAFSPDGNLLGHEDKPFAKTQSVNQAALGFLLRNQNLCFTYEDLVAILKEVRDPLLDTLDRSIM